MTDTATDMPPPLPPGPDPSPPRLFRRAVADVWARRGAAARLLALPFVALFVVEALVLAGDVAAWEADPQAVGMPGGMFLRNVALALFVGAVAVGWHRMVLLDEAPAAAGPRWRPRLFGRYALSWFVIGFLIGLLVIVLALALYLPSLAAVSPGGDPVLLAEEMVAGRGLGHLAWILPLALVPLWVGIALFQRIALGLPEMAVTGAGMGFGASWRMSRPLRRPIAVAALAAAAAQLVVLLLAVLAIALASGVVTDPFGPVEIAWGREIVLSTIILVVQAGIALVGASLLTAIWRVLRPNGLNVAENSD
ncbi:hypothetical protein HKCCE2091_04880 [Rhodobacterales bacterium HKCCE2091]|nr:hypothetical protein [Rhodobacterales bacterium HKCCE2091]